MGLFFCESVFWDLERMTVLFMVFFRFNFIYNFNNMASEWTLNLEKTGGRDGLKDPLGYK